MPANVEIKARVKDAQCLTEIACSLTDQPKVILHQEDTYFNIDTGRLKMRQIENNFAELIFYNRPNSDGPKLCQYQKQTIQDYTEVNGLKEILKSSLGVRGIVKKTRELYMAGQTRIHVDTVEKLGHFMELEVVLKEGQTTEDGNKIAVNLMKKLGVSVEDLISCSYIDLLEAES